MKKLILLLVVFFAVTFAAESQNKMRPWLVGASTNYVDFMAVPMPVSEQLTNANWMGNTILSQLKVARLLSKEIVFAGEFSLIKLEQEKLNAWTGGEYPVAITNNNMWRIQGQFAYKFANGYLLNEDAMFDPYVFLGMNGSRIDDKTYLAQSTGVGLNIWFTDWLGANAEGSYDWLFDWNDYFHYSFGLVVRFGKKSDMDKDGIGDKKDICPNTAGLAEFKGCPDTDGDGVTDKEDKCPTVPGPKVLNGCPDSDGDGVIDTEDKCPKDAGSKVNNGCPDSDGDGVIDLNDQCPNEVGMAQYNGCPDSDNDGISDSEDECPTAAGLKASKGCPDTDLDGIPDQSDNCPNEKGTIENKGCPIVKMSEIKVKEVENQLQSFSDYVEFETNKYVIKEKSFANLNEIVKLMQEYPNAKWAIEGHADDIGQDADNQVLSESRAYAMQQYFVDKGIDPKRMTFVGFGESRPRDTNATPEGRARNRRVEIRFIQ